MDRDRDRGLDRDRERRDDRFSNTYRPRSPGPRGDTYRGARSPIRPRGLLTADTYTPGGRTDRPRSRSPPFRRRSRSPRRDDGDRWRARRSPPRRAFSPRRDDFRADRARSPRRGGYDSYKRSPLPRERSPLPRGREREVSPVRRRDSPPRAGRFDEPRSRAHSPYRRPYSPPRENRDFRRRSPSLRRERAEPYTADTWRRSSRSPARPTYGSNDVSGRQSAASSRRSSPPVHPTRANLIPDNGPSREAASVPRSPFRGRDEREGERDYDREREYPREREVPLRPRETPPTGPRSDREYGPGGVPTGPSSFSRAPPTGPSTRGYHSPALSPPMGPGSNNQPSAYPRSSNPVLGAPTRPRGGGRGGFGGESYRDFSGPGPRRGSWGGGRGGYYGGPHSGPRGGGQFAPPFRGSSNSTSTTYPRTIRFTNHLADLPKEVPGGQKAPELYDKSKISKIEEEARKLREIIAAKEAQNRQGLREWDALEHESNNVGLRAELAEQHLRSLNGDGDAGGAAF